MASTATPRDHHLLGPGPKRILALDGGGVRGVISLAFLERLEAILRQRHGADTRLADYFDLIGGTSTGAIIATGLALGMPVARLLEIYLSLAQHGFRRAYWHRYLVPKFRTRPLEAQIHAQVGHATLGSPALLTGLAIVAKRIDTGSVWLFHNHPRGPYYDAAGRDPGAVPNRDLKLAQLLRASTAAPTYFAPQHIEVARGITGTFVDGGVSPHNNPALLMLLLATARGYGFRWPIGADKLLLLSIGTGHRPLSPDRMPWRHAPAIKLAELALESMMQDCNWLGQTLLQFIGDSPQPWRIDSEIGDLANETLGPQPALHYQRYDLVLSEQWLLAELGLPVLPKQIRALARMDRPAMVPALLDLARVAAERQVRPAHLPVVFDLPPRQAGP